MAQVELKEVKKTYGNLEVIHGVDLKIHDGEFVVLVGPSGCGKSTALRMVAGLEEITKGEVYIGGEQVNDIPPKERGIAMVFQNYALYPHMNVFRNMSFSLELAKRSKEEINTLVNEAADILGLHELLERKPSELSGGQRQRVAMGRAIVRHPKVFLFDEPLSNLDAKLRNQMRVEIRRLHDRLGNTIIYVTHDQLEAMTLADRIVVMRDGYIEQIGEPIELFENPANIFVAGFIGTPPMNLIECKIQGNSTLKLRGSIEIPIPAKNGIQFSQGQSVTMGIRPKDMSIDPIQGENIHLIETEIDLIETLGSETLLHLKVGDEIFIGRFLGKRDVSRNQRVQIHMNLNNLHIFDTKSTQRIY